MLAVRPDKEQIFCIRDTSSFVTVVTSICYSVKKMYQDWNLTVWIY